MLFRNIWHASGCFSFRLVAQSSLSVTVEFSLGNFSVVFRYLQVKLGGSLLLSVSGVMLFGFLYGLCSMCFCLWCDVLGWYVIIPVSRWW